MTTSCYCLRSIEPSRRAGDHTGAGLGEGSGLGDFLTLPSQLEAVGDLYIYDLLPLPAIERTPETLWRSHGP
jgi:hypothetical protein